MAVFDQLECDFSIGFMCLPLHSAHLLKVFSVYIAKSKIKNPILLWRGEFLPTTTAAAAVDLQLAHQLLQMHYLNHAFKSSNCGDSY